MTSPPNPLDAALRPIATLLNESIAEVTPARELCQELDGTVACVRVSNTALAMTFRVRAEGIELESGPADDADIAISGSLLALARLVSSRDEHAIRDGSVDLMGDAEKARAFQRLLSYARPDPEERLARVVGDTAANAAGRFVRRVGRWSTDVRKTMAANLREYLQEESRDLPSRYETEHFARAVDTLRDDVERLAARIDRLGDDR